MAGFFYVIDKKYFFVGASDFVRWRKIYFILGYESTLQP